MNFHQPAYDRNGVSLRTPDPNWEPLRFWFDAWWSAAHPRDCAGLTYLDVGCCEGLYPLRFSQRGGFAMGVNPSESNLRLGVAEEVSENRYESTAQEYQHLKSIYPEFQFKVIDGGFSGNIITPDMGRFDYVSCMNVLEYLPHPAEKIAALFGQAKTQVMVTTDICFDGTRETPELSPLKRQVGIADFVSWSPWPCRLFVTHFLVGGFDAAQGVLIARRNGDFSDLPEEIRIEDLKDKTATQIAYELH